MDALETALNWSRAGWPVFPCRADGVPSIHGWQREATTDVAQIEAWAGEVEFERVGVVPGLVGCFVLDVDMKKGKNGEASLDTLCAECGFDDWEYPQQSTRSGGRHLFFRGTFRSSVSSLGEGLDTRGGDADGGLGFVYAYRPDPVGFPGDIPAAPDALLARSGAGRERDENPQEALVELDQPANIARGRAYLRDLKAPAEGERNLSLFKTACTLKDLGLSLATVFDLLEAHPHVTGDPPLCLEEGDEFNNTVRSAYRNGQLSPGRDGVDAERLANAAMGYSVPISREVGVAVATSFGGAARHLARFWGGLRDAAPPSWLLSGIFPACSTVGLYGPGGSFKSFVALDFLCHVAAGKARSWAEKKLNLETPRPVVYVSGEGAVGPRLRAWEAKHGVSEALAENFLVCEAVDLGDQDDRSALKAEIDRLLAGRPPAIICFDTLARATPGQEENSNRDMGAIVKVLDGFKDAYQTCVMAIHHTPKNDMTWRGATAVWNALDSALLLKRAHGTAASMTLTRQKDAPTGQRWAIKLEEFETGKVYDEETPERALAVDSIAPAGMDDSEAIEQQDAEERVRQAVRAQGAAAIIEALDTDIDAEMLAKQMTADGEVPTATMLKWLRGAVVRGAAEPSHPMFPYLIEKKPLRFGKKKDPG